MIMKSTELLYVGIALMLCDGCVMICRYPRACSYNIITLYMAMRVGGGVCLNCEISYSINVSCICVHVGVCAYVCV